MDKTKFKIETTKENTFDYGKGEEITKKTYKVYAVRNRSFKTLFFSFMGLGFFLSFSLLMSNLVAILISSFFIPILSGWATYLVRENSSEKTALYWEATFTDKKHAVNYINYRKKGGSPGYVNVRADEE